ncbi:MAG: MFS transporter [Granulosicoccus sp.]
MTHNAKHPEQRLALYYAVLFATIGSVGPFFALWLNHKGIDAAMIGVIAAAPSVAMVMTTMHIGAWADRLADWRTAVLLSNWSIFLINCLLLVSNNAWFILVIWTLGGVLMMAKIPIMDAASLSLTNRRGTDYARVRVFGSVGFVLAVVTAGALFDRMGIQAFIWVLLVGCVARILASHALPQLRISDPVAETPTDSTTNDAGNSLFQPAILLTIAGSALINASHAFFYTFGMLQWSANGLSEFMSSLLWGSGVVAEIVLMWLFASVSKRVSARACLIIAGGAGILRWSITAQQPDLAWLFFSQLLHAATFGLLFLATANFISRRVSDSNAARGQAFSATLTTSCMAIATLLSGLFYESWGVAVYRAMAVLCLVGVLLVAASYRAGFVDRDPVGW